MAKIVWAIVCRRVITDQQSNTVTYVDAVEQINFSTLPSASPPVTVGTLWQRQEGDETLELRLRLLGPDKKLIASDQLQVITLEKPRHRVNVVVDGFEFREEGEHTIVIDQKLKGKWKRVALLPLAIELAEQEQEVGN